MAEASLFSQLMELAAREHQAVVNLHDISGISIQVPALRVKPEQLIHHGAYCRFAKFHGRNIRCSQNKRRSVAIATARETPFWGCCPFGVWDMAWPFKHGDRLMAVLYLGHFQAGQTLAPVEGALYEGPALPAITEARIRALSRAGEMLVATARLILADWIRAGGDLHTPRSSSFYRLATHRYIDAHFSEHVRLQDFARSMQVHPHHLGKMILQACGESFSLLLKRRRIEEAKLLLRATRKPVTAIAYDCGFQDGNYFSTVFRQQEGCSPRTYRRQSGDA